jgi:hypothetical protein
VVIRYTIPQPQFRSLGYCLLIGDNILNNYIYSAEIDEMMNSIAIVLNYLSKEQANQPAVP